MVTDPKLIEKYIEHLIKEPLNPVLLAAILETKTKVSSSITLKCQGQPNSWRRKRYIRLQLCRLVRTADTLYTEVRYEQHRSLMRALFILLELINEINGLLPECDPKVRLPKVELDRARRKYYPQVQFLTAKMTSSHIDLELIRLSLKPLREFLDKRYRHFSKRQFCYMQGHVKGLNSLVFDTSQPELANDLLLDKLIGLNYNDLVMFNLCIDHVRRKMHACGNYLEKKSIMKAYKERWKALPLVSSGYNPLWKNVRNSLIEWLIEERRLLKNE